MAPAAESGEDALNKCKYHLDHVEFGFDGLLLWMAGLALVSAIVEGLLEFAEHRVQEGSWLELLRRLYKELTILGLMSFM
jgi:hypothetical protein